MARHALLMWGFDRSTARCTKRKCASCWRNIKELETMIGRLSLGLAILASVALAGCGSLGVKPWQRDVLAREEMRLDSDPLDAAIDDHLYFSKEASSGGRSFAGGGCGCN